MALYHSEKIGGGTQPFRAMATKTASSTFTFELPTDYTGCFLLWTSQVTSPSTALNTYTNLYMIGIDTPPDTIDYKGIFLANNTNYQIQTISFNSTTHIVTITTKGNPGSLYVGGVSLY